VSAKDRFAELEKKVHQIADRLCTAQEKHAEYHAEIERLKSASHTLEQEIKSLKKEREQIKNRVERILETINRVSGE
jgi:chromosome segregation ATPase